MNFRYMEHRVHHVCILTSITVSTSFDNCIRPNEDGMCKMPRDDVERRRRSHSTQIRGMCLLASCMFRVQHL
ncbi:hypothetical protein CEXT_378961 [Caerostris extrusa]|uniref:Secreted protein n=1 Tax=Caerostris extrusa TaxID=172846 RepID=A0AAV4P1G7_CAEEX|nr:hypothetical protein CEXT_378961 [Caerostris extrusa]